MRLRTAIVAGTLLLTASAARAQVSTPPASGVDVLEAMRAAYAGKWFTTLTFVQRTTVARGGTTRVSTWYESLHSPDRLRIDIENPTEGNGVMYTADSVYVVRAGQVTRKAAQGNPFLPFVEGVYTQPLEVTRRQLAPYGFDLSRMYLSRWRGRPVYVVGAKDSTDLTSPQFWVDRDRLVVVRMLVAFGGSLGSAVQDVLLDDYVPAGGGWLATKVVIQSPTGSQTEEYTNWTANPPLPDGFFVAEQWRRGPHWAAALQTAVDSSLLSFINGIRAVDSHAHPMRPVAPGAPADSEFDALPLDGIPPFPVPARLSGTDPIWREAQTALFGAIPDSTYKEGLTAAAANAIKEHGLHFPEWVLDQAGIDVMLANRVAMGPGLEPPRFRWVAFVDALMYPLDTHGEAMRTPDVHPLYPKEEALLRRYMHDLGVTKIPATLDTYVASVVIPTIERQHAAGAVAVKFEAAYLRSLDFADPDPIEARRVYAHYANGGIPKPAEYKSVEDYLFRVIAREAGRVGEAVQIHTLEDFGGYYSASTSTPFQLEAAFNDSSLRQTNFIIVHGGWPFYAETEALLAKPNVYADISMVDLILPPAQLAPVLRQWLTQWPDKVLFGTDAFDGGPTQGWEQGAWVASTTTRRALAMALTAMLRDGEVTRSQAETLARMVMRDNAIKAYKLGG